MCEYLTTVLKETLEAMWEYFNHYFEGYTMSQVNSKKGAH
jgi:hypothetical protein